PQHLLGHLIEALAPTFHEGFVQFPESGSHLAPGGFRKNRAARRLTRLLPFHRSRHARERVCGLFPATGGDWLQTRSDCRACRIAALVIRYRRSGIAHAAFLLLTEGFAQAVKSARACPAFGGRFRRVRSLSGRYRFQPSPEAFDFLVLLHGGGFGRRLFPAALTIFDDAPDGRQNLFHGGFALYAACLSHRVAAAYVLSPPSGRRHCESWR